MQIYLLLKHVVHISYHCFRGLISFCGVNSSNKVNNSGNISGGMQGAMQDVEPEKPVASLKFVSGFVLALR
jgi:hypothetical protein